MKPLIKWSGGKKDEISIFQTYFPSSYETYVEPFVGGGAVYFYLEPTSAVISDVHTELIDFYKAIQQNKAREIYNFMTTHDNTEEVYYHVRDKMPISSALDNAKRFYYLRKTCYRGMMRYNKNGGFNIPFGRYKNLNYEDLLDPQYTTLLSRTKVCNDDFESIFQHYNDPSYFMFLDPPYDSTFTDYGYCQFGEKEHRKLAECFQQTRSQCLMVIGKTPLITELYGDYIVAEYPKKYRFKLHSGRVDDSINTNHVIIRNYNT